MIFNRSMLILLSYCYCAFIFAEEIVEYKSKEIGENTPIPQIELSITKDAQDGVNMHIEVAYYNLESPINQANHNIESSVFLHGYAQVFVNEVKFQRLYGTDIHIPENAFKEGINHIAVALNSHQHENWISNDQYIIASLFVDLSQEDILLHQFSSQPINISQPLHTVNN